MKGTTALLIGLTALLCSAEGNIARPKRDADGTSATTDATTATSPVTSTDNPIARRSYEDEEEASDDDTLDDDTKKAIDVLERLRNVLDLAIRATDEEVELEENNRKGNVNRETVTWLTKLRSILQSEINGLIMLISDGEYDPGQRYKPKNCSRPGKLTGGAFLSGLPVIPKTPFDFGLPKNPFIRIIMSMLGRKPYQQMWSG